MASITFPALTSGVTFDFVFPTVPWTPADSMIGSGSTTQAFGAPGGGIIPNVIAFDLSTLGSIAGVITAATLHLSDAGTYSTAGPGTDYTWNGWGNFYTQRTQADGPSWANVAGDFDVSDFFVATWAMEDLPTVPVAAWPEFAATTSIDNGVTFGYTISALSITFDYTPSAVPIVTDVTPTHGDKAGGTVVTLTGTDLDTGTNAFFGGTAGSGYVAASSTSATVVSPAHAVGQVTVTVA